MIYSQYLVDFIVFLALLEIVIKVFFLRDEHVRSWNIIAGGYILFFIGHIASYGNSWVYVFMQYIFGILSSIALTYGVWTMYEKVFIHSKEDSSYYIYPTLLLSLFILIPFFLYENIKNYIFYLGVLESITWIVLAITGLFYTIALKVRLPKVLLYYLFNIKRTSDVLLISFSSILLWKISVLMYLVTGKISLYNLSEYFAKPIFVLSFIYFIWFSLVNKKHRDNSDELLKVEKVMIRKPVMADINDSLKKVLGIMHAHGVGSVIFEEGIITERDILKYFSKHSSLNVPASKIMTKGIITVSPDILISEAIEIMHEHNVKRLPVKKEGRIIGLVTETLLLKEMNNFASEIIEIAERHNMIKDDSVYNISVGSIMKREILFARPKEKLRNILKKMIEKETTVVVVGKRVFTEHMIVHVSLTHNNMNIPINEVASLGIAPLPCETSIFQASRIMKKNNSKYILVSDKGKIVGYITQSMVLSVLNSLSSKIISLKIAKSKYILKKGESYYIKEKIPVLIYSILIDKIENNYNALCITRSYPEDIKSEYHIDIPIVWVSKEKSDYSVYGMDKLKYTIQRFMETSENSVIAIDCIESLIKEFGKKNVHSFLKEISDLAKINKANIIASSPFSLEGYEKYRFISQH